MESTNLLCRLLTSFCVCEKRSRNGRAPASVHVSLRAAASPRQLKTPTPSPRSVRWDRAPGGLAEQPQNGRQRASACGHGAATVMTPAIQRSSARIMANGRASPRRAVVAGARARNGPVLGGLLCSVSKSRVAHNPLPFPASIDG